MRLVHVHLQNPTPRSRYAVEQVLGRMLGWEVRHVSAEEIPEVDGPVLNYGPLALHDSFHVVPSGLLEETTTGSLDPVVVDLDGVPMLFPVDGGVLPFDPFAAAFYLLTRYEEWVGVPKDAHDRPLTASLHGARHGYLHRPVVDEWALLLAGSWRGTDTRVPLPDRRYGHVATIDLDNGFKYMGRPLWRTLGSIARDVLRGEWSEIMLRGRVLLGAVPDPYDIYEEMRTKLTRTADRVLFFVLAADRGPMDHAVPLDFTPYATRIHSLVQWSEVGVHPSYRSSSEQGRIAKEKAALALATGVPVRVSRQHFLRSRIPETYREVELAGIEEEHGMGLHDRPGFRAGTCTPYDWFDIAKESETNLTIHPFAVMDNSLRHKMGLRPEDAVEQVSEIIAMLKGIDGTFTGLWHESFLGVDPENDGWRDALFAILEKARP